MTERRTQEERRKQDMGCACARETNTVQGGCGKALTPIEFRRLADRRSTPKVAQTEDCKQCGFQPDMCLCPSIPDHLKELLKSASNCVSQSDPNCTPLPMGVPKMEQEIASNCGSSSTPSTPELPVGVQPAQPKKKRKRYVPPVLTLLEQFDKFVEEAPLDWLGTGNSYDSAGESDWLNLASAIREKLAPPETPAAAQQDIREQIGKLMHESWAKTMRGHRYHGPREQCTEADPQCGRYVNGANRSCALFHADLIPWEELPERKKDINRHGFDAVLDSGILVPRSQLAAAESRLQEATRALRTIADWPFNIQGDCVADARKLAERTIDNCRTPSAPDTTQLPTQETK